MPLIARLDSFPLLAFRRREASDHRSPLIFNVQRLFARESLIVQGRDEGFPFFLSFERVIFSLGSALCRLAPLSLVLYPGRCVRCSSYRRPRRDFWVFPLSSFHPLLFLRLHLYYRSVRACRHPDSEDLRASDHRPPGRRGLVVRKWE